MSTSRRIVALLVVAAALSCHRVAAAEQFDHAAQLGVVEAGERMCLIIPNAKLIPNDVVHIIFPEAPQRHVEAKVTGKSAKNCSRNPDVGPEDSFYFVQTTGEEIDPGAIGLGITNSKATLKLQDGLWGFNPSAD